MHRISIIHWLHILVLAVPICMAVTTLTLERVDKLEKNYVSNCIFHYIYTYK